MEKTDSAASKCGRTFKICINKNNFFGKFCFVKMLVKERFSERSKKQYLG